MERNYNIMSKKRRDIVEFVKEVEKYPCLYDRTVPEYANRVHIGRAWSIIAKKANTTVPDCRDRWKSIRQAYTRSLQQQQSDKPPKIYYLSKDLKFLRPFISIFPLTPPREGKKLQSQIKDKNMDFEVPTIENQEISDDSYYELKNDTNENAQEFSRISFRETMPNSIENGHVKQNGRNAHNNVYSDDKENNPRKMFLLSMLPEIRSLTETEMRIFMREVISIIDNIILNKRT